MNQVSGRDADDDAPGDGDDYDDHNDDEKCDHDCNGENVIMMTIDNHKVYRRTFLWDPYPRTQRTRL